MPAEAEIPFEVEGGPVAPEALASARARAFAALLLADDEVGCRLVEAKQGVHSWLLVQVAVDLGQEPLADIQATEPLALGFDADDRAWPVALALRRSFPRLLLHLIAAPGGEPVGLCLSEEPWSEMRRRWTPQAHLRLLRTWLIDTARGALHRPEQPLEPYLPIATGRVFLPEDILEHGADTQLVAVEISRSGGGMISLQILRGASVGPGRREVAAMIKWTPPRVHVGLSEPPATLKELLDPLDQPDDPFRQAFDGAVDAWRQTRRSDALPLLIVATPLSRTEGASPERPDVRAFVLGKDLETLAAALGSSDGKHILLGSARTERREGTVPVRTLLPIFRPSRSTAALLNGLEQPSGRKLAAIGAGALGSQVLKSLAELGERITLVADEDQLLPHNRVRHDALSASHDGHAKAQVVAKRLASAFPDEGGVQAIVIDASAPAGPFADSYREALASADVILDFAASVAVSRQLALGEGGSARRISAFLSPSGYDLVLLVEDADRSHDLYALEFAYYRSVLTTPSLTDHLARPNARRYANSCRAVSGRIPQTAVAAHAALAAATIRSALDSPSALAAIFRLDRTRSTVDRIDLPLRPAQVIQVAGWRVAIDADLLDDLGHLRSKHLPNETGGVLVGDIDHERRRIALVGHLPAPEDSVQTPRAFVRGAFGLGADAAALEQRMEGALTYVGEWHSHPAGMGALPSLDDVALFGVMAANMAQDGLPAVMLIRAEGAVSLTIDGVVVELTG